MKGLAFFISPDKKIIKVDNLHIDYVIKYPKKFGYTEDELKKIYKKHKEPYGHEGNAREEILLDLVKKGWVRIREYPNQYWSIQVLSMNRRIKELLYTFSNLAIKGKKPFKSKIWDSETIRIVSLKDNKYWQFSFKDVANDILYTECVPPPYILPVERMLLEVVSIEKYKPEFINFKDYMEL